MRKTTKRFITGEQIDNQLTSHTRRPTRRLSPRFSILSIFPVITLFTVLALSGCSSDTEKNAKNVKNPLTQVTPKQAAEFLVAASAAAEVPLGLHAMNGRAYGQCRDGQSTPTASQCQSLYKGMVAYAQQETTKDNTQFINYTTFKPLTVADLTNKSLWLSVNGAGESVKDAYTNVLFMRLPIS